MRPVLEVCETRRDGVNFPRSVGRCAWTAGSCLRLGAVRHPSVSDSTAFFPGKTKRVASPLGPADGVRTEARPARRRGDDGTSRAEVRVLGISSRESRALKPGSRCAPFECRGDVGTSSFATALSAVIGASTSGDEAAEDVGTVRINRSNSLEGASTMRTRRVRGVGAAALSALLVLAAVAGAVPTANAVSIDPSTAQFGAGEVGDATCYVEDVQSANESISCTRSSRS